MRIFVALQVSAVGSQGVHVPVPGAGKKLMGHELTQLVPMRDAPGLLLVARDVRKKLLLNRSQAVAKLKTYQIIEAVDEQTDASGSVQGTQTAPFADVELAYVEEGHVGTQILPLRKPDLLRQELWESQYGKR